MADSNDIVTAAELTALSAVVQALKSVPREAYSRVIDAALVLLRGTSKSNPDQSMEVGALERDSLLNLSTDIRRLKELKQPRSASEMAALVAFYLSEAAQPTERKETVETADMIKYFKQAHFNLPGNPNMTLVNAKNAGYFDAVGNGQYRLNPVGYNLVAHNLPRGLGESTSRPRKVKGTGKAKRK
jgi:hypothetical protein